MTGEPSKLFLRMLKESGVREVVLPAGPSEPAPAVVSPNDWRPLREKVLACTRCRELVRGRHSVVFGSGDLNARLVFVGEAPGAEEDRQGLPFVGRAGQLLTKMIEAIGRKREDVFIANVLKCRPPGNRPPFLKAQLALIQPRLICALGAFAARTLLKTNTPISALRGAVHHYQEIPVICTFHPAYLLRNPSEKRKAWEDLKKVRSLLNDDRS